MFLPFHPPALLLILKAFPTNAWNLYYAAYGFYFQVSNDFRNFFDFSSCYLIPVILDWQKKQTLAPPKLYFLTHEAVLMDVEVQNGLCRKEGGASTMAK